MLPGLSSCIVDSGNPRGILGISVDADVFLQVGRGGKRELSWVFDGGAGFGVTRELGEAGTWQVGSATVNRESKS